MGFSLDAIIDGSAISRFSFVQDIKMSNKAIAQNFLDCTKMAGMAGWYGGEHTK